MIFDGKAMSLKAEDELRRKIASLEKKLRLVIVRVGEDSASVKYTQMKKEVGERIGVQVEIVEVDTFGLESEMRRLALSDEDGLMLQLPVPGLDKEKLVKMLSLIPLEKDVDGLNPKNVEAIEEGEQSFVPATVRAVEKILDEAFRQTEKDIDENLKIAVVGAQGNVGRPLVSRLKRFGMDVGEFDLGSDLKELSSFDVVISCVGAAGIIKEEMVKKGLIAIDVGFPNGDFEDGVVEVASFFTPVPGGVGPVTVISLFENLVECAGT